LAFYSDSFGSTPGAVLNHADYHIWVTENAPAGESILALLLSPVGYRITSVQDRIAAVAVLRADPADVILVDLVEGDAVEMGLLDMLRKFSPDLPMVLCVEGLSEAQGAQYRQLGVVDIGVKPIDPRAMVEQIELAGQLAQKADGTVTPRELERAAVIEPTWAKPLYHELRMTELAGPLVSWD
jgi:DNA-binding NtrC family response regulator